MARLSGTARSDIEISYRQHPVNENNDHYNGHYYFFHGGGFQSCPLFSHYLFHYFVTYSEFGSENDLMVILMDSIMGQLMATLKAHNIIIILWSFKVPIIYAIMMFIIYLINF